MKKILLWVKQKLTSNSLLKLASIIFAILVWLAVININDPTITRTISGIPIEITNEDAVTDLNMIYNVTSSQNATIVISGKRSIVSTLTKADFRATAPLDEMSQVYAVPVYIEARNTYYQNTVAVNQKTQTITLSLEALVTKSYDISINYIGEPENGYVIGNSSLGKTSVDVTAPDSVHNLINKAVINVDVTDANKDISSKYKIRLLQSDGTDITDLDDVELSAKKIKAYVDMLSTKEVPVEVSVFGEPKSGYVNTGLETTFKTVTICGEEEDIENIKSIVVPSHAVNINNATSTLYVTVDLDEYLPDNVTLLNTDDERFMDVTVNIEELITKTYTVSKDLIKFTNIPSGYDAEFTSDEDVEVDIVALQADQDAFDINEITAYVDLTGAKVGKNRYDIDFVLPDNYTVGKTVRVRVNVSEESEEETGT